MSRTVFLYGLLAAYLLFFFSGCEYNVYLPQNGGSEHRHNTDKLCQDGIYGHHWECTVCGYSTEVKPHVFVENTCSVCGFQKPDDESLLGGFEISIVIHDPVGVLKYFFDENTGIWHFSIEDKNKEYPIDRWTWYLFGEEQTVESTFELITPHEISYEVRCEFGNDYGMSDATVVITGKTKQ